MTWIFFLTGWDPRLPHASPGPGRWGVFTLAVVAEAGLTLRSLALALASPLPRGSFAASSP